MMRQTLYLTFFFGVPLYLIIYMPAFSTIYIINKIHEKHGWISYHGSEEETKEWANYLGTVPVVHELPPLLLCIVHVDPVLLCHPLAGVTRSTVLLENRIGVVDLEGLVPAVPPQVAEVESGARPVDLQGPCKLQSQAHIDEGPAQKRKDAGGPNANLVPDPTRPACILAPPIRGMGQKCSRQMLPSPQGR